eukprot:g14983.t1
MVWLPELAYAAVEAGQMARREKLEVTKQPSERRHATVYNTKKGDSMTAESWILSVSQRYGEAEAHGAGTPLVCLYHLGWVFGKHPGGLMFALLLIVLVWAYFLKLSLEDNSGDADDDRRGCADFAETWIAVVAMLILSACLFHARISKRSPAAFQRSRTDHWVTVLLETFLANTLMCASHGGGFVARRNLSKEWALMSWGVTALACPVGFLSWYYLQNKVLDRQHAYIRKRNLAKEGGRGSPPQSGRGDDGAGVSKRDLDAARTVLTGFIRCSRDVRMVGLPTEELNRLADFLGGDVADFIRFYTERVEPRKAFDLLCKFQAGYKHGIVDHGGDLSNWITLWLEGVSSPWASVRELADGSEPPDDCPLHDCIFTDPKERIWWLFGAVAKVCDDREKPLPMIPQVGEERIDVGRCQWYALMASALCVNQNPTAVILAMEKDSDEAEIIMKTGCEQVLRRVDSDQHFCAGRALVFTDAPVVGTDSYSGDSEPPPPVITYSAAGVSNAEESREAVMLGKDAFDSFWWARGCRELTCDEKAELRRNTAEWSKKMVIHVDFKSTFAFLGLNREALANVLDAAKRGHSMHLSWVMLAILFQRFFPHLLLCLAMMAVAFLQVGSADQCAHLLFLAIHLWPFSPLALSDTDMDHAAWIGFVLAVVSINGGSVYFGMTYVTVFDKVMFWVLLLGSVAPGLWFFYLGGKKVESGRYGTVTRSVCPVMKSSAPILPQVLLVAGAAAIGYAPELWPYGKISGTALIIVWAGRAGLAAIAAAIMYLSWAYGAMMSRNSLNVDDYTGSQPRFKDRVSVAFGHCLK